MPLHFRDVTGQPLLFPCKTAAYPIGHNFQLETQFSTKNWYNYQTFLEVFASTAELPVTVTRLRQKITFIRSFYKYRVIFSWRMHYNKQQKCFISLMYV